MPERELLTGDIASMAKLLGDRILSPVELLRFFLDRIERFNQELNAFTLVDEEGAERAARESERRIIRGEALGPLDGIPLAFKDLVFVKGVRIAAGSKIFRDFVPQADATVVRRLRERGAVVVGMTNTSEFALGATTDNPHFGPTLNPWDAKRVPGGSSGGSGAAVAASLVPAAFGTDTGGSVRIPSALCGIVGLKATYGRVSRHGVFPLSWSLDHVGPMTRTVRDAALLLEAIAGPDGCDPTTRRVRAERGISPDIKSPFSQSPHSGSSVSEFPYSKRLERPMDTVRIGLPSRYFFDRLEPGVEEAVRNAVDTLAGLGARPVEIDWPGPGDADAIRAITLLLISVEGAAYHGSLLTTRKDDYGPEAFHRLELGRHVLATEYLQAQRLRTEIARRLARVFETVDVIAAPTCPVTAFARGTQRLHLDGTIEPAGAALVRFTQLANMTGWPAVSVPCALPPSGMPVGLQLIGQPFDEATVLQVAHAYEKARGPWLPAPVG